MLVATITSVLESVGDYYAAARACCVPAPPSHAINRGIAVEGLGSVLSGLFGAGHGITTHSAPITLIRLTGVITALCTSGSLMVRAMDSQLDTTTLFDINT